MNEQSNLRNEKKRELSQSKAADGKIFNPEVIALGVRNKMSEEKESDMVINLLLLLFFCCYHLNNYHCHRYLRYSHFLVILLLVLWLPLLFYNWYHYCPPLCIKI